MFLCSLVEQIQRIKEKALGSKDEEQVEYLTTVLDALTTCVSSLHEREHESLLNEVFDISIWQATPVSCLQQLDTKKEAVNAMVCII